MTSFWCETPLSGLYIGCNHDGPPHPRGREYVSLNLWSLNTGYMLIFLLKKCEQLLHLQKLLTFFSKNTCESDIVLTRTINTLTINEFVKLTMLWTTGPEYYTYETNVRKRLFRHVRLAKIQITLRNRTVWSESSLGTFWVAQDAFYFILFIFYFIFFFSCG